MNQHTKIDRLFVMPTGQSITELRDAGNKLILYTESKEVYRRFADWKYCFYIGRYYDRSLKTLAFDLHFDRRAKRALLKALNTMEVENVPA